MLGNIGYESEFGRCGDGGLLFLDLVVLDGPGRCEVGAGPGVRDNMRRTVTEPGGKSGSLHGTTETGVMEACPGERVDGRKEVEVDELRRRKKYKSGQQRRSSLEGPMSASESFGSMVRSSNIKG